MHKKFTQSALLIITLVIAYSIGVAQEKVQYKVSCIGFYNLENLFDTIPGPNDTEFTPDGVNRYTSSRYWHKMHNMADVISQVGSEMFPGGPAVLGVCEIENRSVLEDLTRNTKLKESGYGIVHYDSPDARGVDVGLIYRTDFFTVTSSRSARLLMPDRPDFKTRDQLVVTGLLDGEQVHIIVGHWPSRRGGEKRSLPLRVAAAQLARAIVDSIRQTEPAAKIIIMGDLNDDPDSKSVVKTLGAKPSPRGLKPDELFCTMYDLYRSGIGSLAYQDSWNLFDNLIVSQPLVSEDKASWTFFRSKVFNRPFLQQSSGQYAGYPFRTYVGNNFAGGYSDHFPVYLFLIKEKR